MNAPGRVLLGLALLAAFARPAAATARPAPAGDWAGWAYFDGGHGDAPLRIRIDGAGSGLSVRFDELPGRRYDLPCRVAEWSTPRLVLERVRRDGTIRLEGALVGDTLRGRITWNETPGTFELIRSAATISRTPPEGFADVQGSYRLDTGTLVIGSRFWGELLYTDLGTGRQGTLFPVDRDSFFAGGAMYVPRPVEATVRFTRDADGHVQSVQWTAADGTVRRGAHVTTSEEPVTFTSGGTRLAGTLLVPAGTAPRPAAVVLGGSNWETRSECRRDAEILASFGIAALVFDRRGHGESGGDPVHAFRADAEDAAAAVRLLGTRSDVRADAIGVTGRSQGGWIAPLAVSIEPAVRYLILFVPPGVSPASQEQTRRDHALADLGLGADARARERRMLELGWVFASTGTGWDAYLAARRAAQASGVPEGELEPETPDDSGWAWDRLNWRYDPVPALERVRCPVIALYGGADRNVVPDINRPPLEAALAKAGNRDVTLIVVPGANHGLVTLPPGARDLPLHRQTSIGDQGWPDLRRWVDVHLFAPH